MPYRGPDRVRMAKQTRQVIDWVGQTAVWREYVSAGAAGTPAAGIEAPPVYREQTVTAMFGQYILPTFGETSTPAGIMIEGQTFMISRFEPKPEDEIVWRDTAYVIDSDPVPSHMVGQFMARLKRGV